MINYVDSPLCLTCWVNSIPCESCCNNKSSTQEEEDKGGENDVLDTTKESILSSETDESVSSLSKNDTVANILDMLTLSEAEKANIDVIEEFCGMILYHLIIHNLLSFLILLPR